VRALQGARGTVSKRGATVRAGFIGVGDIGLPMAHRLLLAGFDLVVHDLDRAAAQPLVDAGARFATSPAELARDCDVVGVCVPGDPAVRSVVAGDAGLLSAAQSGLRIAVHSTLVPDTVCELSTQAAEQGVLLNDACMTGGAPGAEKGTLTYMVGGTDAELEALRPYLDASAEKILHAGEIGAGARMKLCVNINTYLTYQAVYESRRLAKAAGVNLEALEEAGRRNGQLGRFAMQYYEALAMQEDPGTAAQMEQHMRRATQIAEKDLDCIIALSRESGIDPVAAAAVRGRMAELYGLGDDA